MQAQFSPGSVQIQGSGYTFNISNSPTIYVDGTSADTATLDDAGGNDEFSGLPTYSVMQNAPGNTNVYWNEPVGFGTVNAVATAGTAYAYLYDSAGNDTFTSNSTGSQMTGSGYSVHASGFQIAIGFLTAGGTDTANLSPNTTTTNYVYGTSKGTVNYFDSKGNDTFYGVPQGRYSVMLGTGYYNEGISFGTVVANSTSGGTDTAVFYDTSGNDTYTSQGNTSSMSGKGYLVEANGFAINDAFFSRGADVANLYAGTIRADFVYGTPATR